MGVVGDSIASRPSVSSSFTVLRKESQNLHVHCTSSQQKVLSIQCVTHAILKSFSIHADFVLSQNSQIKVPFLFSKSQQIETFYPRSSS